MGFHKKWFFFGKYDDDFCKIEEKMEIGSKIGERGEGYARRKLEEN